MTAWHRKGGLEPFEKRLLGGMKARGYPESFARRIFNQIKGFGEYGFPESHSASFALLAYVSSWLKYYHPAAFTCALLNSQPLGFYRPAQLVQDARRHGVTILPVDVNESDYDCTLEGAPGRAERPQPCAWVCAWSRACPGPAPAPWRLNENGAGMPVYRMLRRARDWIKET